MPHLPARPPSSPRCRRSERWSATSVRNALALANLVLLPGWCRAQTLYVTSDRTIANGNPINGSYELVSVGIDAAFNPFPGLTADVTGGSVTNVLQARTGSTVSLLGGDINRVSVYDDSTVNLLGASITVASTPLAVPVYAFGSGTINVHGGNVTGQLLAAAESATLNVYGRGLTATFLQDGQLGNYAGSFYVLGGSLSDGTSVDGWRIFDGNTGGSDPGQNFRLISAAAAPEPGTLALDGCVLIALCVSRQRSKRPGSPGASSRLPPDTQV